MNSSHDLQAPLAQLGSGWWPPLLLELPQPGSAPPEAARLDAARTALRAANAGKGARWGPHAGGNGWRVGVQRVRNFHNAHDHILSCCRSCWEALTSGETRPCTSARQITAVCEIGWRSGGNELVHQALAAWHSALRRPMAMLKIDCHIPCPVSRGASAVDAGTSSLGYQTPIQPFQDERCWSGPSHQALILVQELQAAQQDCRSAQIEGLLQDVCMAAADEHSKELLCRAGLQKALAGLLFSLAASQQPDMAQAALCSLWNLASPLQLREEVAHSSVAHALCDLEQGTGFGKARGSHLFSLSRSLQNF